MEISKPIVKHGDQPDETRAFVDKGKADVLKLGESTFGYVRFEPGFRWSTHVKPLAGTESCECAHLGYCLAGRMIVEMNDGTQLELGAGDFVAIPPGHDAWVVGDEACVFVDFVGMEHYAERGAVKAA